MATTTTYPSDLVRVSRAKDGGYALDVIRVGDETAATAAKAEGYAEPPPLEAPVFDEYPKVKYQPGKKADDPLVTRTVASAAEEDALEGEWYDTPADFPERDEA